MRAERVSDIEVTQYDASEAGQPRADFDWSLYNLLCIKDRLGGAESGLAWLAKFSLSATLPPTIVLAENNDDFVIAKIRDMPRTEHVLRDSLDVEVLAHLLDKLDVDVAPVYRSTARNLANMAFKNDSEIMRSHAFTSPSALPIIKRWC
jgi:hypothetical protein